jgi:hypothetical protein
MSAFIVHHEHINAIMTFAAFDRQTRDTIRAASEGQIALFDATRVGRFLLEANARGRGLQAAPLQRRRYVFRKWQRVPSPVEVLKACQCLDFQCCEHEEWQESPAKRMLDAIAGAAIEALPGYDSAPWAISEEPRADVAA